MHDDNIQKLHQSDVITGFTSSGFVRLLFEYLEKQDIDPEALLGIPPPEPLDRGLQRYPMVQWRAMLQLASDRLDDPLLGLRLGKNITTAHLGVMGYILSSCQNLASAMIRMREYERLIHETSQLHINVLDFDLTLTWGADRGHHGPLVDECGLASFIQIVRNIAIKTSPSIQVCFTNKTPPDIQPYIDFFGCPVLFEQPVTSIRVGLWQLATKLRKPDEILLQMLEQLADMMLEELPQVSSNIEQLVRQSIARLIYNGEPQLEQIATELNITPRTLRRRLDEEGLNYRALLDDVRKHLAERYLLDPRLRLGEIAQLLGYSEQSAFTRAFRRWTGYTPHERQQQLLHGYKRQ
ncbi:AraC family transcriptional regulator [Collimonas humicola]|uniref:AraC family transcriptional regulator n=1 Tax=Collimonas humicola TaxID=2825886 RepID=UPI001B8D9910|nr:AraC family transcriptional regulator [Collimonas humicola]